MRYQLTSTTSEPGTAIRVPTELRLAEVEQQAQHLRGWALIRGAKIEGHAFLRLLGEGETCVVELPASAVVVPDKESGLTIDTTAESPAMVVAGVPFDAVRNVLRALRHEFGSECGRTGAADFTAGPEGWKIGTLTWMVRELPASLPAMIDVEDAAPPVTVVMEAEAATPALAGRRFGLHWRRWRRQDS